ncbi:hypothetical protein EN836_07950 [Mesorhizobium sp. M1C.F.Ca.ET.193.01.1.1]|nr:hypothetical protein EN853_07625 [Mesorhizobium sp. M1C.F.Ca.ET.210.01.1.1]TGQ73744.1 hypothetical protein EN855_007635 [Mesorhizobium sp. M1C.F.Ca.ET.212.01.1.1]TGR12446.1 hypothetical protein EN847_07950 [Mesorhizobium sp. M1C.F.Ca.ET.204.01.1.1]TGR31760.1 hypothetical protein EN839_07630 [Mesorhizobium sp. M1C.F.Ca.ET.196.01.1.1]TGR54698.1 hypothetical protein EN838_07635 [Mesorhizobium sp. M1C.F.Ca.ET.195.01.1.1]TGR67672.1 hypothetical protein EN835_007625 [Mesorhizobium sp. M1C.F.Ca.ET
MPAGCPAVAVPLYLFVLTQFRAENRFTLFLELLYMRRGSIGVTTSLPGFTREPFRSRALPIP